MIKMKWPCAISAITHSESGRPVIMNRTIEGYGDLDGAVLKAVLSHRNKRLLYGVEIKCVTPIGQNYCYVVDPDTKTITHC